jgi:hypothetical protein
MPSEGDNDGLFLDGQDRRSGLLGSRRHIRDGGPSFPLGDRLWIDPVALRQRPQALLMVWTALAPILPMKEAWQVGAVEYLQRSAANGQG